MSRGRNRLASPLRLRRYAPVFAALGDERRLTLLTRLSDALPRSISQLAEGARISRQGITKHLRVLEEAGLVRAQAVGRQCFYEMDTKALVQAQDYLGLVSRQWEDALGRLKAFVEREERK